MVLMELLLSNKGTDLKAAEVMSKKFSAGILDTKKNVLIFLPKYIVNILIML